MTGVARKISKRSLELAGAAALAAAFAFATGAILAAKGFAIWALAAVPLATALSFWGTYRTLCRFADAEGLAMPDFALGAVPDEEQAEEELLLDQIFEPARPLDGGAVEAETEAGVLELADVLAQLPPDSRVVRLFDVAAMPTAGQLQARIERHLKGDSPQPAPADATDALHQALADLRRSLR